MRRSRVDWREDLMHIGDALDANRVVHVLQGGSVTPDPSRVPFRGSGQHPESSRETERQGSHRPAAGPREGSANASTVASGPADQVLGDPRLAEAQRKDVAEASRWRPQMRLLLAPPVLWIHYWFRPLENCPYKVFLLVAYPQDSSPITPAGWAWWHDGIKIGREHTHWGGPTPGGTHWGEASICASEEKDDWDVGDPLINLLDLYSVWVARHLYRQVFGRWPGPQYLHTEYERLTFHHQRGELCGCGSLTKRYEECCLETDLAVPTDEIIRRFRQRSPIPMERRPQLKPWRPVPDGLFCPTLQLTPTEVLDIRNQIWGLTQAPPARPRWLRFVVDPDPKGTAAGPTRPVTPNCARFGRTSENISLRSSRTSD